jgi:hypothetical protein
MPSGVLLRHRAPRALRAAALAPALLAALASLAACNNKRVSRIDPASVTDLSGRWNDADSRLVANALVTQALGGQWLARGGAGRGGRPPAVIVGRVANRTMEHIPIGTFVRDVERALVTSNAVTVVASADERAEVRGERADQQQNATADTRAASPRSRAPGTCCRATCRRSRTPRGASRWSPTRWTRRCSTSSRTPRSGSASTRSRSTSTAGRFGW